MKKQKITIKVEIENNQVFTNEYNLNQKLIVVVNKTLEHFNITADGRVLRRADGKELTNLQLTIDDTNIFDGETLRFFKKVDKPDRDKRFAI